MVASPTCPEGTAPDMLLRVPMPYEPTPWGEDCLFDFSFYWLFAVPSVSLGAVSLFLNSFSLYHRGLQDRTSLLNVLWVLPLVLTVIFMPINHKIAAFFYMLSSFTGTPVVMMFGANTLDVMMNNPVLGNNPDVTPTTNYLARLGQALTLGLTVVCLASIFSLWYFLHVDFNPRLALLGHRSFFSTLAAASCLHGLAVTLVTTKVMGLAQTLIRNGAYENEVGLTKLKLFVQRMANARIFMSFGSGSTVLMSTYIAMSMPYFSYIIGTFSTSFIMLTIGIWLFSSGEQYTKLVRMFSSESDAKAIDKVSEQTKHRRKTRSRNRSSRSTKTGSSYVGDRSSQRSTYRGSVTQTLSNPSPFYESDEDSHSD